MQMELSQTSYGRVWMALAGTTSAPQLGATPPPPMKGSKAVVFDENSVLLTGGLTDDGYTANTYELENGRAAVQKTGFGSGITPKCLPFYAGAGWCGLCLGW